MPAKSFLVKVELTVQKISCPGVWLCSNGKISLQFCMLDCTIQTDSYKPLFPINFNEKFVFYKTFLKERRLNELQRSLNREWLCVELIQWKNCDEGVVLASFQTTLDDLLYPSALKKSSNLTGTDVDLLMEPTKLFPGTISPKLELRTKTTIEETFPELKQRSHDKIPNNRKSSCFTQNTTRKLHPKRVCHTVAYSKAQQRCYDSKKDRPIFKYSKPDDDLILRLNPDKVVKDDIIKVKSDLLEFDGDENYDANEKNKWCYCVKSAPLSFKEDTSSSCVKSIKSNCRKFNQPQNNYCSCGSQHKSILCPVCSKYECTFSITSTRPTIEFLSESTNNRNTSLTLCSCCRRQFNKPTGTCPGECDDSRSPSEKKVCFCLPQKESTCNLAQKLHERLKRTLESGAAGLDYCIRDCEVCE